MQRLHRQQIDLEEAIHLLKDTLPLPGTEILPLTQAAGRVLSHALAATVDHPSVDDSAMDGIACRLQDSQNTPVILKLVGESRAGEGFSGIVSPGECVRIYTGAPVPEGADAICKVEDLQIEGDQVTLLHPARSQDIRHRGSDFQTGQLGLQKGDVLSAARLALAASMGHREVQVYRKLRVGILSTGDEVIEVGEPLSPGQVYDSNKYGLYAQLLELGLEPVLLPHATDHIEKVKENLKNADLDVLLTSGGVSMGNYDIVRDLLFSEGEVKFWKVNLRPGGPALCGLWQSLPVLGLPGNPVSALVVFEVLFKPAVFALLERTDPPHRRVKARAGKAFKAVPRKTAYWRARLSFEGAELVVQDLNAPLSNMLRGLAWANALVVVQPGAGIEAGDLAEVIWL
ncbi:molybdopterin molybdotransferase MoeA [Deinococcus roseus]|uniref:Molybdopterin molybdenumtransferase n=1 Tax=Deinococcus roseus TaxID=392414 RepID=A0ABQ2D790_9DEIO|nr:gephyrin-like molybdotransferase Glp [Deinococcus roseus]GGJ46386.1 molybdopterin molybdenumtransferase MoeA [Deinococcus roseus]